MKAVSYALAAAIALALFATFGSAGSVTTASVTTHVSSMYAVLPDGALIDLRTSATPGESPVARLAL